VATGLALLRLGTTVDDSWAAWWVASALLIAVGIGIFLRGCRTFLGAALRRVEDAIAEAERREDVEHV
jgi:hypothetical protein